MELIDPRAIDFPQFAEDPRRYARTCSSRWSLDTLAIAQAWPGKLDAAATLR